MIPYDDLVAALASWRAKQGLPVDTQAPASSGASRSGPKLAPPGSAARTAAAPVDHYDVDEAALLEEASYGDDYGAYTGASDAEATSIGGAPSAGDATIDEDMLGGDKRSDW